MSEEPTLQQIFDDPTGWGYTHLEAERLKGDIVIGQAARMLYDRKQVASAALMRDVEVLMFEEGRGGFSSYAPSKAFLDVPGYLHERFTDEHRGQITAVLRDIRSRDRHELDEIVVRDVIPQVGLNWREEFDKLVGGEEITNQGQAVRLETRFREDGLYLTNKGERRVYIVLRAIQEAKPDNDTIGIAPLAGLRTPGHTYWPDFLVTYRGRVGVIEVDSPYHRGRRDGDASRERLLIQAGVHRVGRIAVEDTEERPTVEKWVTDFLQLLSQR